MQLQTPSAVAHAHIFAIFGTAGGITLPWRSTALCGKEPEKPINQRNTASAGGVGGKLQ